MSREHLTYQECERRFPRLVRCMQWTAILSSTEATCCLRDWRDGWQDRWDGGEAVTHYGGPRKVITQAIENRHLVLHHPTEQPACSCLTCRCERQRQADAREQPRWPGLRSKGA